MSLQSKLHNIDFYDSALKQFKEGELIDYRINRNLFSLEEKKRDYVIGQLKVRSDVSVPVFYALGATYGYGLKDDHEQSLLDSAYSQAGDTLVDGEIAHLGHCAGGDLDDVCEN